MMMVMAAVSWLLKMYLMVHYLIYIDIIIII